MRRTASNRIIWLCRLFSGLQLLITWQADI